METVKEYIKKNKKSSFSDFLLQLMRERHVNPSTLYKAAYIDRKLFSKIISVKDYKTSKKTVCALALALKLDAKTSKQLIKRAGYILTSGSKFDLIIRYCIENRIYDLQQAHWLLEKEGLGLFELP